MYVRTATLQVHVELWLGSCRTRVRGATAPAIGAKKRLIIIKSRLIFLKLAWGLNFSFTDISIRDVNSNERACARIGITLYNHAPRAAAAVRLETSRLKAAITMYHCPFEFNTASFEISMDPSQRYRYHASLHRHNYQYIFRVPFFAVDSRYRYITVPALRMHACVHMYIHGTRGQLTHTYFGGHM